MQDYSFQFYLKEDVNKRRQILLFFEFLGIQLPESSLTFDKVRGLSNREEDWKKPNSLLKRRFRRIYMKKDFSSQRSRETFLYLTTDMAAVTSDRAPVVQKLDSAIHRINHYPADKY